MKGLEAVTRTMGTASMKYVSVWMVFGQISTDPTQAWYQQAWLFVAESVRTVDCAGLASSFLGSPSSAELPP